MNLPVDFHPAPGWPSTEEGWVPPSGWTPPIDWQLPPEGWAFYRGPYGEPAEPPNGCWQPSESEKADGSEPRLAVLANPRIPIAGAPTDGHQHFVVSSPARGGIPEPSELQRRSQRDTFVFTKSTFVEPTRVLGVPNYDIRYRLGLGLLIIGWLLPLLTPLESWVRSDLQYNLYPSSLAWIGGLVPFAAIVTFVAGWLLLPGRLARRIASAVLGLVALAGSELLRPWLWRRVTDYPAGDDEWTSALQLASTVSGVCTVALGVGTVAAWLLVRERRAATYVVLVVPLLAYGAARLAGNTIFDFFPGADPALWELMPLTLGAGVVLAAWIARIALPYIDPIAGRWRSRRTGARGLEGAGSLRHRGLLVPAASAGALVIILTAGLIGLGGTGDAAPHRSDDVTSVLADARANNSSAAGAPQQAVVNGWVARDLLALQIDRSDVLIAQQQRTNQLLVVGILLITMIGLGMVTRLSLAQGVNR